MRSCIGVVGLVLLQFVCSLDQVATGQPSLGPTEWTFSGARVAQYLGVREIKRISNTLVRVTTVDSRTFLVARAHAGSFVHKGKTIVRGGGQLEVWIVARPEPDLMNPTVLKPPFVSGLRRDEAAWSLLIMQVNNTEGKTPFFKQVLSSAKTTWNFQGTPVEAKLRKRRLDVNPITPPATKLSDTETGKGNFLYVDAPSIFPEVGTRLLFRSQQATTQKAMRPGDRWTDDIHFLTYVLVDGKREEHNTGISWSTSLISEVSAVAPGALAEAEFHGQFGKGARIAELREAETSPPYKTMLDNTNRFVLYSHNDWALTFK